jgi:hypothetical protein
MPDYQSLMLPEHPARLGKWLNQCHEPSRLTVFSSIAGTKHRNAKAGKGVDFLAIVAHGSAILRQ